MARMLAPARALMSRLRFSAKLVVVALVFAVPVVSMVALLYGESQRDVETVALERQGIEYIAQLASLLHALETYNAATAEAAGQSAASARSSAAAAAEQAAERVKAIDALHGARFGSSERAQNILDHWKAVHAKAASLSPQRRLAEHRAMADEILDNMYFVAERSRLLLDPVAKSAYLQDVSVSRLPEMAAAVAHARAILASGAAIDDPAALPMAYQLALKNFEAANRGMVNAFGGSDVVIDDPEFVRARATFDKSGAEFLEAMQRSLGSDRTAAPAALRLSTPAVDAAIALDLAALAALDRELLARARADRAAQLRIFALVALSLVLAAYLLAAFSVSVRDTLREAMGLAGLIAGGDLSTRMRRASRDEIGDLVDSLNAMSDKMAAIVAGVKKSSGSVMDSAGQVATANSELSSRTERQASSLEEIAATIEELSATVAQGSERLQEAATLITEVSGTARTSNATMALASRAMEAVSERSAKIAEITGVIDGIAFQTNILALNAAVEAARVGVDGRGFAVVAGEIRLLAKRCALAASEIKALIAETVDSIRSGGERVGAAGDSLATTVEALSKAVTLMENVTGVARQQSASIEQISSAVIEMNGVTQQNAAFVQQTSAIARDQEGHAQDLVDTVGSFRLDGPSAAPAPRLAFAG